MQILWTFYTHTCRFTYTHIHIRIHTSLRKREAYVYLYMKYIYSQVIVLLVILVMRTRIELVMQLFREAGKAVCAMPALLFQPIYVSISPFNYYRWLHQCLTSPFHVNESDSRKCEIFSFIFRRICSSDSRWWRGSTVCYGSRAPVIFIWIARSMYTLRRMHYSLYVNVLFYVTLSICIVLFWFYVTLSIFIVLFWL